MSELAAAVRALEWEIGEAQEAAQCVTDGSTDTVDALDSVSVALGKVISTLV